MSLKDSDVETIVVWASKHPRIEEIWLFGSRARGDHCSGSDLDLAIKMSWLDWFDWHGSYEKNPDLVLSMPVHLECYDPSQDFSTVNSAVQSEGILIYNKTKNAVDD